MFGAILVALIPLAQQDPAWQRLHDGATLTGWHGDPRIWSVQDGAITGSTVGRQIERNTFLVWRGEVEDFELTFEARLEGANNSGLQYRSRVVDADAWQVHGYQIDVHPQPEFTGMLYEEGLGRGIVVRRGVRAVTDPSGKPQQAGELAPPAPLDLSQWRRYRVAAYGDHLLHEVDGVATVEFVDRHPGRLRRGVIALQVHAGAPMMVQFRDLRLRRWPGPAQVHWIWGPEPQQTALSRLFVAGGTPKAAELVATCDNRMVVSLNGEVVLRGDDWTRPLRADVTRWLRPGANELRVDGTNEGGPAAAALRLRWRDGDAVQTVTTDPSWHVAAPSGSTRAFGLLGSPGLPWSGELATDAFELDAPPQPARPAPELTVLEGFVTERIYTVPRAFGSWVAMATAPDGSLYASDQRRGLYRIWPATLGDPAATTRVEPVQVELDGAQGLCWAFDTLYAMVNGRRSGLYRLQDRDEDGDLDAAELLLPLRGDGEHGPHAVVPDPDGQHLLLVAGNHTRLPQLARSRIPVNWGEDMPVPAIEDPRGHANGIRAPGGWIARVKPDGSDVELIAVGLRNAYDVAADVHGELFTYDADMEWDLGLPWYRPTRILHVTSGAEFGWRTGTGKWPVWYPDSLPGILDMGEGSPTGLLFGTRAAFPEAYHNALFALDWTNGVVHATRFSGLDPASWRRVEPFVRGRPFAVTDAVIGKDGAMYVVTGGRGTESVLYRISHRTGGNAWHSWLPPPRGTDIRRELEKFHGRVDPAALDAAWPHLNHVDAKVAYAARLAVEAQPVATWRARALREDAISRALPALLALVRCGEADDVAAIHAALLQLPWRRLAQVERRFWLRILALTRARFAATARGELQQILLAQYPNKDLELDRELAMLLVAFEVPGASAKLFPRLEFAGGDAKGLADAIHVALLLRLVTEPWTAEQRERYFAFFPRAARAPGGKSYLGYLGAIRREALRARPEPERSAIGRLAQLRLDPPPPFEVTPPRGPGQAWTVATAMTAAGERPPERDFAGGRNLFHAAGCAACHRMRGSGGAIGPDLTSAGSKFGLADMLTAIVEPSRDITDQYASSILRLRDGTTRFGRVVEHDDGELIELHPPDPELEPEQFRRSEVASIEPSPVSQMPAGLLNALNAQELQDLLAYLLAGGDPARYR